MIRSLDIDLPFDAPSAVQVLEWGALPGVAPYTHRKIAEWCDQFWCQYIDLDAPPEIERLLPILAEVDMEWDMRSMHRGPMNDHTAPVEDERLPTEWFEEWLASARAES